MITTKKKSPKVANLSTNTKFYDPSVAFTEVPFYSLAVKQLILTILLELIQTGVMSVDTLHRLG